METKLNSLILLLINSLFVGACNHVFSQKNSVEENLTPISTLSCTDLSAKVPRRYLKTASIVGNNIFIYSQKSQSKIDVHEFRVDDLSNLGVTNFSNAERFKEFENGLLIETGDSSVVMVGKEVFYVDFPSDEIRYFKKIEKDLYVVIDKGAKAELYKIDPNLKKTFLLKNFKFPYSDVRMTSNGNGIDLVFLHEKNRISHFRIFSIKGKVAKKVSSKLKNAEIIDWDITDSDGNLLISILASDDYYSDKQFIISSIVDFNSNKVLKDKRISFQFKNYDAIKASKIDGNSFMLAQSDKENDRSLDFFKLDSKLEKLGRKKYLLKEHLLKSGMF